MTKDDCVLEIGPGIGTLTQYLAEAAGHVIAVEIDRNLIPILEETLAEHENVTVINQDILKTDIKGLADAYHGGRPLKVVANLPYYITTPIVDEPVRGGRPGGQHYGDGSEGSWRERMMEGPGSKEYGALSLAVQYYARPEIVANVPPIALFPGPMWGRR